MTHLELKEQGKRRFFELCERLADTSDPVEREQIKKALAQMIFGE